MKIAHINHSRCGEPAATTYVLVPNEMTEEQFKLAVRSAADSYKNMLDASIEAGPRYVTFPGFTQIAALDPNVTVGEVLADHRARLAEKQAADELAERARHSFGWYLEQSGLVIVQRADADLDASVDWGHRHGRNIRYDGIPFNLFYFDEDEANPQEGCEKGEYDD